MASPAGQYYLNGKDLFNVFGVYVLKGSINDFLKFPDAKDAIEHDWLDSDGTERDLSRVFFKSKEITLELAMFANSLAEWHAKYDKWLSEWRLPGLKRFQISALQKSYYVYYKSSANFSKITNFTNSNKLFGTFNFTVIEQEPKFDNRDVYLITENGLFIIT